jgi:hypothetical protein
MDNEHMYVVLGAILGSATWALSYWYLKQYEAEFIRKVEDDSVLDLATIIFAPFFAIMLGLKRWHTWQMT